MINSTAPVIIIGMHRSGTTMLTNLLHDYGVFMGSQMEQNSEAIGFLKINESLLRSSNASWSNPLSYQHNKFNAEDILNILNKKSFIKTYSGGNENLFQDNLWGWKDPRNTLTIELWKEIFPDARIIHIYRNPIDVANSLMVRENRFTSNGKLKWYFNVLKNYIKNGLYIERSKKLSDIEKGIDLWKLYVEKALSIEDNIIHIKYEDILSEPAIELKKIINFLDISLDEKRLNKLTFNINDKRKYAFINNDYLKSVYLKHHDDAIVKHLKYNEILNEK